MFEYQFWVMLMSNYILEIVVGGFFPYGKKPEKIVKVANCAFNLWGNFMTEFVLFFAGKKSN